ncbi:MAG TPA: YciI family protein [Puia sp.]|nr:YciI family protein [Puia sp.]
MKEYLMLFRSYNMADNPPTPEQAQKMLSTWQSWIQSVARDGHYVGTNRLHGESKTVFADNVVKDGPFAEGKEVVGGYLLVSAASIDDAVEIAKGCPIYGVGGSVELREVLSIDSDVRSKTFLAPLEYA